MAEGTGTGVGGGGGLLSPEQINPSSVMMSCVYVNRCLRCIPEIRFGNVSRTLFFFFYPVICLFIRAPMHFLFQVFRLVLIPNYRSLSSATCPGFSRWD